MANFLTVIRNSLILILFPFLALVGLALYVGLQNDRSQTGPLRCKVDKDYILPGEPVLHSPVNAPLGEVPILVSLSRGHTGEELNGLICGFHCVDLKLTGGHGLDDILAKHEMFHVGRRNDDALLAG